MDNSEALNYLQKLYSTDFNVTVLFKLCSVVYENSSCILAILLIGTISKKSFCSHSNFL